MHDFEATPPRNRRAGPKAVRTATRSTDTELKPDHVYRVVGRPLQLTRPARDEERFEGLRYVGTTVPYRRGSADVTSPMEMFYWFAERRWVLFKPGTFRADELYS